MSAKAVADKGAPGKAVAAGEVRDKPLLGRKSVLMGMLASGFVVANAARPSDAFAGTTKPSGIVAGVSASPLIWKPATAFAQGQQVISPDNNVVCANAAHTSSAAYATDVAKWTLSTTFGKTRTDTVWVDDMAGSNDDAKLTAALAYAAAQALPPVIRFSNRTYMLAVGGHTPFTGMKLWGPEGYNNPERGVAGNGTRLQLSMSGGWFVNSSAASTFTVSFGNLAFIGGSSASVITQNSGAGTMYCLMMHNISSSGLYSVLGTQASKLLITAATFDGGGWEINNCYSGAFHLGGSDNTLWPNGCLLDSATAYNTAGSAQGQYHLWCDYLDKTYIGPMYITCEGGWGGIKVSGPAYNSGSVNSGVVNVHGARIEGRNPGQPCDGANVRIEGGQTTLNDCWISYGMASPATMGHSPTDAGVIHQTAGRLIIHGGQHDRTGGMAETVPYLYSSGGSARVRDLSVASRGGIWAGLPRAKANGGSVSVDDTATAV